MGRIFISYSHKNSEIVEYVNDKLCDAHILTWLDKRAISDGDRWETNIVTSISACNVFIVFHSKEYRDSAYCKKEWNLITEKRGGNSVIVVGLDDCKDSFVLDDVKNYQFLNYDFKLHSYDDLYEKLVANADVKKCLVISREGNRTVERGTPFFNALQNLHHPVHHQALETLIRFALRIKEWEADGRYICENADFSSLLAYPLDNGTFDLELVGKADFSSTLDINIRNNYICNVFHALFRFGLTQFSHTMSQNLVFERPYTHAEHRFAKVSADFSAVNIDTEIYNFLNEKIQALYCSFSNLDELIDGLTDVMNASKFYESLEARYGGKYYEYSTTPTVIAVAKLLYALQQPRRTFCEKCIPRIKNEVGQYVHWRNLDEENMLLQGQYGGGKTAILATLFNAIPLSLYVDLSNVTASANEGIIESVVTRQGSHGYGLKFNELCAFSSFNERITLLIDDFDELSVETQSSILAEITEYQNVFRMIVVSNRHDIESKLSLTVSGNTLGAFARYMICPLQKREIVEFVQFKLASKQGVSAADIIREFELLDEDDRLFSLFGNFTKLNVLIDSISDWNSFSVEELKTTFHSEIKVFESIFESNGEYSLQMKIAFYFRGCIIDIRDVIMKLVAQEIDLLKLIAYNNDSNTIGQEYCSQLRFRDYYPVLEQTSGAYSFVNDDIRSYFAASYIISRIRKENLTPSELEKLLERVKEDYTALKYLRDFDIMRELGDVELLLDECNHCEELLLTLYKIIQYYDGELVQKEFLCNARIRHIPDKFFFRAENIERIVVPPSVEVIGRAAFSNMSALKEIDFAPNSLGHVHHATLEIKPWAVLNCPMLTKIHLGSNYRAYHHPLFGRCEALAKLSVDADNPSFTTIYNEQMLVSKDGTVLYTSINSLSGDVILPEGLIILENNSLSYLQNVTSIVIPSSVREISTNFTDFCDNLKRIEVKDNPIFYSDERGYLYTEKDGKKILFRVPSGIDGDLIIPDGTDVIGSDSISCCTKIKSIFVPSSVSVVENYAFADTNSLTCVKFADVGKVASFGNYIFLSTNKEVKIVGNEEIDLHSFNAIYCKPKADGKLKGAIRQQITSNIFTECGFELLRAGELKPSYPAMAIVRDVTLFDDKTYGADDFNVLLIGLTEYNSILTKSRRDADRYVAELINKNHVSMVMFSRDLPLVEQFESLKDYGHLMIARSAQSSTAVTRVLTEIIKHLGEKP